MPSSIARRWPRPSGGWSRCVANWRGPTASIAAWTPSSRGFASGSPCYPSWRAGWKAWTAACRKSCAVAREDPTQPLGDVRGVVADLFHVDVDSAPLVEVALGERAQFIVLASAEPIAANGCTASRCGLPGGSDFWDSTAATPLTALDHVDLSAEPGVMGRADRFIESAAEYQPLARRLLGRTWLVDRMSTALRLAQSIGRGLEFVTSDGELIGGRWHAHRWSAPGGDRHAVAPERASCVPRTGQRIWNSSWPTQASAYSQLDKERGRQEELVASSVAAYTTAAGKLADCHRQSDGHRPHNWNGSSRSSNGWKTSCESRKSGSRPLRSEIETNGRERASRGIDGQST